MLIQDTQFGFSKAKTGGHSARSMMFLEMRALIYHMPLSVTWEEFSEVPLDIFVRWKPLKDQAQGWHTDINDGIGQKVRPFLLAGDVGKNGAGPFCAVPLKLKDKDRGKEPHRPIEDYPWFWCEEEPGTYPMGGEEFVGARWNNVHLTLARKNEVIS